RPDEPLRAPSLGAARAREKHTLAGRLPELRRPHAPPSPCGPRPGADADRTPSPAVQPAPRPGAPTDPAVACKSARSLYDSLRIRHPYAPPARAQSCPRSESTSPPPAPYFAWNLPHVLSQSAYGSCRSPPAAAAASAADPLIPPTASSPAHPLAQFRPPAFRRLPRVSLSP